MNGCLFKILLLIFMIVVVFLGFPYFKEHTLDSAQSRIESSKNTISIIKKIAVKYYQQKSKEDEPKDNNQN